MNRFAFFITLFSTVLYTNPAFTTDSTKLKKGYFLSISAGLTSNTVYGTMVERNNQFGDDVKMEKKAGFVININIEKNLSNILFLKTGLNFIHKQVNPMVNTFAVYKDELKTNYLSIPLELGINIIPTNKSLNFALTLGTLTNIRITDNSKTGPDRVAFKSSLVSESLCAGARLSYLVTSKARLFFQYHYLYDITNSYVETLYWSTAEPNKNFVYKYKTHELALGIHWTIK